MKHSISALLALLCAAALLSVPAGAEEWRPKYAFEAYLGESLSADDAPGHTTTIACHAWDLQWSELKPAPWEHVRCDARYDAIVWVSFDNGVGVRGHIDPPRTNPCAEGSPVYRVQAYPDRPTLDIEHEWCK